MAPVPRFWGSGFNYDAGSTVMTTAAICAPREFSWGSSNYRGEQYDSDLGLYFLRARYYNPNTGRFMSRDPEDGIPTDPRSLHKYLYAGGDPVNAMDPTGRFLTEFAAMMRRSARATFVFTTSLAVPLVGCLGGIALVIDGILTHDDLARDGGILLTAVACFGVADVVWGLVPKIAKMLFP